MHRIKLSPCWICEEMEGDTELWTKYGCSILSQIVGCETFSFESKNGLTQTAVPVLPNMSLIGHKERHFLGQERGWRFGLLSICMECRLFMQLKLSPSVYSVLLPTPPLYMTLVNTERPAELYHGPLRSWETLLCDTLPISTTEQGH